MHNYVIKVIELKLEIFTHLFKCILTRGPSSILDITQRSFSNNKLNIVSNCSAFLQTDSRFLQFLSMDCLLLTFLLQMKHVINDKKTYYH